MRSPFIAINMRGGFLAHVRADRIESIFLVHSDGSAFTRVRMFTGRHFDTHEHSPEDLRKSADSVLEEPSHG